MRKSELPCNASSLGASSACRSIRRSELGRPRHPSQVHVTCRMRSFRRSGTRLSHLKLSTPSRLCKRLPTIPHDHRTPDRPQRPHVHRRPCPDRSTPPPPRQRRQTPGSRIQPTSPSAHVEHATLRPARPEPRRCGCSHSESDQAPDQSGAATDTSYDSAYPHPGADCAGFDQSRHSRRRHLSAAGRGPSASLPPTVTAAGRVGARC